MEKKYADMQEAMRMLMNESWDYMNEDLNDFDPANLPATILPYNDVYSFIENVPVADNGRPPRFFKLGFMNDYTPSVAAKYKGGRGSTPEDPRVRIVKITEFSQLYTGEEWRNTKSTKKADKILGDERHTGQRNTWNYQAPGCIPLKIGCYASNPARLALRAFITEGCKIVTKYFVSIDGEPLRLAQKEEIVPYLIPSAIYKLMHPQDPKATNIVGVTAEGEPLPETPCNTFYLDRIYMIGNLGHSAI